MHEVGGKQTHLRRSTLAGSTDVDRRCVASEALLSADCAAGIGTPSFLAAASTALASRGQTRCEMPHV